MREGLEMLNGGANAPEILDPAADSSRSGPAGTEASLARKSEFTSPILDQHRSIPGEDGEWTVSSKECKVGKTPRARLIACVQSGPAVSEDKLDRFLEVAEQRRAQLLWQALRFTSRRDEAEDLVQEAIFRAFRNLSHFRGEAKMATWLHVIVQNVGREWLRKQLGRTNLPLEYARNRDDEPRVFELPDRGRNPEQCCEGREMEHILLSEIGKLNSVCKRAIEMCALQELSHLEAAKLLGVDAFTIKSRICNGKRMLKRAICRRVGKRSAFSPGMDPAF